MTTTKTLPDWATVGAAVVLEPGSYGRGRKFIDATITRVTKTSVFAKTENGRERRFVDMGYGGRMEQDRLREFGNRGNSWSPDTYLWNAEAESVKAGRLQAEREARLDALRLAARRINETRYAPDPEHVAELRAALDAYEAGLK